MLTVVLWILKIIGLLLLMVLGLVLAVILAVLLVPVRYQAEGSWYGELKASASVNWLLHILSVRVVYEGQPEIILRIFGFRVGAERKQKKKRKPPVKEAGGGRAEKAREEAEPDKEPPAGKDPEAEAGELKPDKVQAEPADWPKEPEDGTDQSENDKKHGFPPGQFCDKLKAGMKRVRQTVMKIKQKILSIPGIWKKLRQVFGNMRQKLSDLGEKKDRLIAFWNDEENRKTLKLLKRQIFAILRHLLPSRVKGRVRFGFDDPYMTGQVLMYLAPFYSLYAGKLELIPVFEEPALEGELSVKGRLRIGTILALAARMMLDRNFRSLLKKWRER